MSSIRVGNVPIILPKFTLFLCHIGCEVKIVGNKTCDFKVAQLLLDAKEWQDVPDLMAYDAKTKSWKEFHIDSNTMIYQGEFNSFNYDLSLFGQPTNMSINKILNLVSMYGHAKMEITTTLRYHQVSPVA